MHCLDRSSSCAGLHIGQCIFSTRLCPSPAPSPSPTMNISRHLKSLLTVSIQFFRGLPFLFLPSGTQCNTWLALLSLSVQHTWPSHFNLLFLMMFSLSFCP